MVEAEGLEPSFTTLSAWPFLPDRQTSMFGDAPEDRTLLHLDVSQRLSTRERERHVVARPRIELDHRAYETRLVPTPEEPAMMNGRAPRIRTEKCRRV